MGEAGEVNIENRVNISVSPGFLEIAIGRLGCYFKDIVWGKG